MFTPFEILHRGKKVYIDSSKEEYEFDNNTYPIFDSIDRNNYELLVVANDRPSKNYSLYFKIRDDKVIGTKKLPEFFCNAARLGNDSVLEYAGIWDYSQVGGKDGDLTDYSPIMYYKVTLNGIVLDSSLTIEKNKYIYGKFMGFDFDERIPVSLKKTEARFDNEMKRIVKLSE